MKERKITWPWETKLADADAWWEKKFPRICVFVSMTIIVAMGLRGNIREWWYSHTNVLSRAGS